MRGEGGTRRGRRLVLLVLAFVGVLGVLWVPAAYGASPALPLGLGFGHGAPPGADSPQPPEVSYSLAATVPVGASPAGVAVDVGTDEVFVANSGSNNVSVISDATNRVVATVGVGTGPVGVAYDAEMHQVFVANSGTDNVSVISDATDRVVATVDVGSTPAGVAYDPGMDQVFVANSGSNDVSVISDGTDAVTTSVLVGATPVALAYDALTDQVFVVNSGANDVSVIADATDTVAATVPVGGTPSGAVYDSAKGVVYVSNSGANDVNAVSDSSDTVLATAPVGSSPEGVGYDSSTGNVFVANSGSRNVSVVADGTNSIVATVDVGIGPAGVAYDPTMGLTYVSDSGQGAVSVIRVTQPAPLYRVEFLETGLPTGTAWFVNISGGPSLSTTGGLIVTALTNGAYTYTVGSGNPKYGAPPGAFVVDFSAVTILLTFSFPKYSVAFTENGLPTGTPWTVTLNGTTERSNLSSIAFQEADGAYAFSIGPVSGFTPQPPAGAVSVHGGPTVQTIRFEPTVRYGVMFVVRGLPPGASWWLNLSTGQSFSSATGSLNFTEPNGTYTYVFGATIIFPRSYSAPGGSFTVAGSAVVERATFVLVREVRIGEVGLPAGTLWWANVTGGGSYNSTGPSIVFWEPRGRYVYSVASSNQSYAAKGRSFIVFNPLLHPRIVIEWTAPFHLVRYGVTLTEVGLPHGSRWCAVVNGDGTYCSSSSRLGFSEPNGTYAYRLTTSSPGRSAPNGTFTVNGRPVLESVTFSV